MSTYFRTSQGDQRFKGVGVQWVFWAISDEYGAYAAGRIQNESGLIHEKGNITIYVKTWAQVLDENRARLQFFQERLAFQADKGESLKYLQERHAKYLEGVFDDDVRNVDEEETGTEEEHAK